MKDDDKNKSMYSVGNRVQFHPICGTFPVDLFADYVKKNRNKSFEIIDVMWNDWQECWQYKLDTPDYNNGYVWLFAASILPANRIDYLALNRSIAMS